MELRDLYDIDKNLCGQTVVKGEPIPKGRRILVVCAIIVNSKNEFLIQKRVLKKNGKFGFTSGHPKSGETSKLGMLTELNEELGLIVPSEQLILFNSELFDDSTFRDLYFYKKDIDISKLTYQNDEVEYAKWASLQEIQYLFRNKLFCTTHYRDFKKYLEHYCHSNFL